MMCKFFAACRRGALANAAMTFYAFELLNASKMLRFHSIKNAMQVHSEGRAGSQCCAQCKYTRKAELDHNAARNASILVRQSGLTMLK